MVRLIHKLTGSDMYVTEERLPEYLAAGHKPAADGMSGQAPADAPAAPAAVSESDTEKPVRKTTRKKAK